MSAQDDEKTEDEQDSTSTDESRDGDAHDSEEEQHTGDDEQDDDEDKYTGEHGEDMSEIGQVSKEEVPDEPSEEGKEAVKKISEAYSDKKTAVMPGTDRTITGTAVNNWLDDEGNPKFGDPDEHPFAKDDSSDDDSSDDKSSDDDSSHDSSEDSSERKSEEKQSAD